MTTSSIEHLVTENLDGVSVIHICNLLDEIYGKDRWFGMDPLLRFERVLDWIEEHGAHYYAWDGPSFYRLAKRNDAIEETRKLGKSLVVIEALS